MAICSRLPHSAVRAAARILLACGLAALVPLGAEAAPKRLALVVGNAAYEAIPALANAGNDADAVESLLAEARFEVIRAANADLPGLKAVVERFGRAVEAAGSGATALVYYAGHAIQLNGNNHLLPVDIRPSVDSEVPQQSVTLGEILKRLDRTEAGAKIVILDACRDNPFDASDAPSRGLAVALLDNPGRAEAGLARVESKGGTFVAFATSPGTSAADGAGQHSPFTAALLQHAREPGAPVEAVFRNVRLTVHETTGGRQIPWETSSLTTPFSFFAAEQRPSPSLELASAAAQPLSVARRADFGPRPTRETLKGRSAAEVYEIAIAWDEPEVYRLFLDLHGDDALALRVHRILSVRLEEMSWAMAARWGDPAQLRRYAAVFEGSAHADEARNMAAAGGAPEAKRAAVCTPARPQGTTEPPPVLRRASLKPPPAKPETPRRAAPPSRPAPRAPVAPVAPEEVEPPTFPPVVIGPIGPGFFDDGPPRSIRPIRPRPGRPYPGRPYPDRPTRPEVGSIPPSTQQPPKWPARDPGGWIMPEPNGRSTVGRLEPGPGEGTILRRGGIGSFPGMPTRGVPSGFGPRGFAPQRGGPGMMLR